MRKSLIPMLASFAAGALAAYFVMRYAPVFFPIAPAPAIPASPVKQAAPTNPLRQAPTEEFGPLPPPASATSTPAPPALLTPSAKGTRPVESINQLGAVGKIYYHAPTRSLFIAMIEKDGMRSIWRLMPDGTSKRIFSANDKPGEIVIDGDSRGRLYAEYTNPARIYRTDDEGATWKLVLPDVGIFWQIADDGQGTLWGSLHEDNEAILYRSTDDGTTWERWKSFQQLFPEYAVTYGPDDYHYKLRHLHGVFWQNGALIVGTGDVARFAFASYDRGETWTKVWDEGFTAEAPMSDRNFALLGPDQLQAHGIALLDIANKRAKEVWSPISAGYAGYVYSLLNAGGFYYAAVHTEKNSVSSFHPKYGVIVSPDGVLWYPYLEFGPVTNAAASSLWIAQGQKTMYASIDGALYDFQPLTLSWFHGKTPFRVPETKTDAK